MECGKAWHRPVGWLNLTVVLAVGAAVVMVGEAKSWVVLAGRSPPRPSRRQLTPQECQYASLTHAEFKSGAFPDASPK